MAFSLHTIKKHFREWLSLVVTVEKCFFLVLMTDHAGPRRGECHPGTKFLNPPVEVNPLFASEERFWRPFFFKSCKKSYFSFMAGP